MFSVTVPPFMAIFFPLAVKTQCRRLFRKRPDIPAVGFLYEIIVRPDGGRVFGCGLPGRILGLGF